MAVIPQWYLDNYSPARDTEDGSAVLPPFTVVIPTFNEAESLLPILHVVRQMADEVLVVDGHSTDGTEQVATAAGATVLRDNGMGKGAAVRQGLLAARNEIVVLMDADGSHDPTEIPGLIGPIVRNEADHVSGSRMIGGSDELHATVKQSVRLFGSQVITLFINYSQGVRMTDCQNGFRAIRRSVALDLGLTEDIHTIEQEMIIKTIRCGYRLREMPSHEFPRANGESTFRILDVWLRFGLTVLYFLFWWSPEKRSPTTV